MNLSAAQPREADPGIDQQRADGTNIIRLAFIGERRRPGRNAQSFHPGQVADNLLCQTITEITLVLFGAHILVESAGTRVLVDVRSALYVTGSEIDFEDKLIGGGFKIRNPNATETCSCGESFSV